MTRINLIHPATLTDKHLLAEYTELQIAYLNSGVIKFRRICGKITSQQAKR